VGESRDLPVLDAVVRLLDEGYYAVTVVDAAGQTGLDTKDVDRALEALKGQYLTEYQKLATGGVPDSWYVTGVTPRPDRSSGSGPRPRAWPSAWPRRLPKPRTPGRTRSARVGCARSPDSSARREKTSLLRSSRTSSCARLAWAD
jgi:hypothetical protein